MCMEGRPTTEFNVKPKMNIPKFLLMDKACLPARRILSVRVS